MSALKYLPSEMNSRLPVLKMVVWLSHWIQNTGQNTWDPLVHYTCSA